jgi:hypothetical protein
MAQGLGLASGYGAGAASATLGDILKQKFLEQLQKQKLAEDIRQADMQHQVQQAQLGQGQQRINLDTSKFGEDTRQFGVTSGQNATRLGYEGDRVALEKQAAPGKMALTSAQTEDLNRQPQEAIDTRAYTSGEAEKTRAFTGTQNDLNRTNALRIANSRPQPLITVPSGYDENGNPIMRVVPKVAGTEFTKPDKETAQTLQMAETARDILPNLARVRQEADALDKAGLFGPGGSRFREFVAGKVGAGQLAGGNAENARLIGQFRADMGLLQTAVARAHAGARGAGNVTLLQHMESIMPGNSADLPTFLGSLDGVGSWMQTYAEHGPHKPGAGGASPAPAGGGAETPAERAARLQRIADGGK